MATSYQCNHCIDVTNLADEEEVQHSILLINGRITPHCQNRNFVKLTIEPCKISSKDTITSIANSGNFKSIINLKLYEDCYSQEELSNGLQLKLSIQVCQSEKVIKFIFKVPIRELKVQPVYVICAGESEDSLTDKHKNILELINLNIQLVQSVFAEKIREAGFKRNTFLIRNECQVFHSQLKREVAWESSEYELWEYFARELLNSAWGQEEKTKFIAFIDCTRYDGHMIVAEKDYSYENVRRHLKAHAALGSGGLALFGSRYFFAWPQHFENIIDCFLNRMEVDILVHPDDSNYRRTYGGVYASTLGAVCHELGHTFDLGHTNDGIMGAGFDYLNQVFTVGNLTENLPDRIVDIGIKNPLVIENRLKFTKLKKNTFLDSYHNQKRRDPFYFSRNCAIILANHIWLTNIKCCKHEFHVKFNKSSRSIISIAVPIKMIEIRQITNSLVKSFYEFNEFIYQFKLPDDSFDDRQHYLFALSIYGDVKKIYIDDANT